jgi:hypothetical protein
MPYEGAFQTTILGRFIRFASRDKLLKYPDEIELPEQFRPVSASEGGEKPERWRSPSNADNRWRGSSRIKVPQTKSGQGARTSPGGQGLDGGIDRSSSDDTVVEGRDEEGVMARNEDEPPAARRESAGENEKHPHLVDWYSETDQENPYVTSLHVNFRLKLTWAGKTGQPPTKHS